MIVCRFSAGVTGFACGFSGLSRVLTSCGIQNGFAGISKIHTGFLMGGANEFAGRRSLEKRRCGADDFQAARTAQQEV